MWNPDFSGMVRNRQHNNYRSKKIIHSLFIFIGEEHFGDWSNWAECNTTCDEGVQNRSRVCENEAAGCLGEPIQTKPCLLKYCPGEKTIYSLGKTSHNFCT
jgi:hypothetical protein